MIFVRKELNKTLRMCNRLQRFHLQPFNNTVLRAAVIRWNTLEAEEQRKEEKKLVTEKFKFWGEPEQATPWASELEHEIDYTLYVRIILCMYIILLCLWRVIIYVSKELNKNIAHAHYAPKISKKIFKLGVRHEFIFSLYWCYSTLIRWNNPGRTKKGREARHREAQKRYRLARAERETTEERVKRLDRKRQQTAEKRACESSEFKETRLKKQRLYASSSRNLEDSNKRELRLSTMRELDIQESMKVRQLNKVD